MCLIALAFLHYEKTEGLPVPPPSREHELRERKHLKVSTPGMANELAGRGKIDAACRDRMVMHLMTAAGASAPADAVFRFTAGEAMQAEDERRGHRPLRGVFRRREAVSDL